MDLILLDLKTPSVLFSAIISVIITFTPSIIAWRRYHSKSILIYLFNVIAVILWVELVWKWAGGIGWAWLCIWSICPDDHI